eukprot:GFYU01009797.1.p1 GENE.GFYU01009797.1~~GFYU01009797.1.p1  ORF type:complete len:257 (-),score=56.23 GFYU01009797.1:49-819(-)
MKLIGLTGGIATGKSTVSSVLSDRGAPIIDGDVIAKQVVEVGKPAYQKVVDTFGAEYLLEDGSIDRVKLGNMVFNDVAQRRRLEGIVNPAVRKEIFSQLMWYYWHGYGAVVLDFPLLFEARLKWMTYKVICTVTHNDTQLQRLMERNGWTEAEARSRITAQMPMDAKAKLADIIVDNNGTMDDLRSAAHKAYTDATKGFTLPFPNVRNGLVSFLMFLVFLFASPAMCFIRRPVTTITGSTAPLSAQTSSSASQSKL